jgi:hypothetical protein
MAMLDRMRSGARVSKEVEQTSPKLSRRGAAVAEEIEALEEACSRSEASARSEAQMRRDVEGQLRHREKELIELRARVLELTARCATIETRLRDSATLMLECLNVIEPGPQGRFKPKPEGLRAVAAALGPKDAEQGLNAIPEFLNRVSDEDEQQDVPASPR